MNKHLEYIKRIFVGIYNLPRIHKRLMQISGERPELERISEEAIRNIVSSTPESLRSLQRQINQLEKRLSKLEQDDEG